MIFATETSQTVAETPEGEETEFTEETSDSFISLKLQIFSFKT